LLDNGLEYIECINRCKDISTSATVDDKEIVSSQATISAEQKAVLEIIANYASRRRNEIIAFFTLSLLASLAIAALGVLVVCGIMSCSSIIFFAVAIVSCVSSSRFLHLLDQQNTERQKIASQPTADNLGIVQTDKTSRQKWLLTACVVLQLSAVMSAASLCPPLCLVVIGILSISLLGINFFCRAPNEMTAIMKKVQGENDRETCLNSAEPSNNSFIKQLFSKKN
jgi:hypothetical protein